MATRIDTMASCIRDVLQNEMSIYFIFWNFTFFIIFFSEKKGKKVLFTIELVSKELNHFGVIADLFRQIGGHSSRFVLLKHNNNFFFTS